MMLLSRTCWMWATFSGAKANLICVLFSVFTFVFFLFFRPFVLGETCLVV